MSNKNYQEENTESTITKRVWWLSGILLLLIVAGISFYIFGKSSKNERPIIPDVDFAAYVSSYTGGSISKRAPILVRIAKNPKVAVEKGDPFEKSWLKFEPSIKGEAVWKDKRTIAFYPSEDMKSGKVYKASLALEKFMDIDNKRFREFEFGFQIIPQSFELRNTGLIAKGEEGLTSYDFKGEIRTADVADKEDVEQMLTVELEGKPQKVEWDHSGGLTHVFKVKGLERKDTEQKLKLIVSGKPIGVSKKGEVEIPLVKKGGFKLIKAEVGQASKQFVRLLFSEPLDKHQDFLGLIKIGEDEDFDFVVDGNELKVYTKRQYDEKKTLRIFRGIKNINGIRTEWTKEGTLEFEPLKPGIRFVKTGNILPSTDGMVLPFEACGLKSVLVQVIKINQERIGQFLQFNDLEGSSHLSQVGKPILKKVVSLENMNVDNLKSWNRFTLELSKLIEAEKGAIYQVSLAFTPKDLLESCGIEEANIDGLKMVDNPREKIDYTAFDAEANRYYFSDPFGDYYDSDYDWDERNNPCNSAFYSGSNNIIKTNLLATDIGLMAKLGTDNSLKVIATDLPSADPMNGVRINVYNYQLERIATTHTGKDGIADISLDRRPFLVEANAGEEWAYLKVNNNNTLSISSFNVGGKKVQNGLKGFIYGDRGVWRPGDSLYLTFMLDDRANPLPEGHPVIFELINPHGVTVDRQVKIRSVKGLYDLRTATSPEAPTGFWKAKVKVGGAEFIKNIQIETVKPNRLKVNLKFPNHLITASSSSGTLSARWLTGALASKLKARFKMVLVPEKTTIKSYKDYAFDDPASGFSSEERTVFDGLLNDKGEATFNTGIDFEGLPPTLTAHFSGKVFEPGGDFSTYFTSLPVRTYETYIGLRVPKTANYGHMLNLGKNYTFKVASVDSNGHGVRRSGLKVSVYKVEWRWWWEVNKNNRSDYVSSRDNKLVKEYTINTSSSGEGSFELKREKPDWGRYYVRVEDPETGYTCGRFIYFNWAYGSSSMRAGTPDGASLLAFSLDKEVYAPGETMTLNIQGNGTGRVFVSLENGTGVLKTYWFDEKKGNGKYPIPITKEMTPNIFVNVTVIQPHGQTVNDLPIRRYGIIGVTVEDPETVLHPVITMADKIKPEEQVTINVHEKNGRAMAYTIALVDEGLLDLTNFKTPNPHAAFYAREALGTKSFDFYDRVIGAYGGQLERLLSIGGGGHLESKVSNHNLRFKPVVKFFGPFFLKKGEKASHSFKMPEYVGSVRTMVVAGHEGAYGFAEETTPVIQPLMLLPTLPRVTGPGETIALPVNVFAMEKGVRDVKVTVRGDRFFEIVGPKTKSVHFDEPSSTLVYFKVKVAEQPGTGTIKVSAAGNGFKAKNTTHLTVRTPNPPQTTAVTKVLQPGASLNLEPEFFGMEGTNSATLEVSGMEPLNLQKRLGFLINYPYGCLEQRVSQAFPQLFLGHLVELSQSQKDSLSSNIKGLLRDLTLFQQRSGGFTYWPGTNYTNDWATSYAGHFMIAAQKAGYQLMPGMLSSWVDFQNDRANSWRPQERNRREDLVQAYRLYTLALAGKPNRAAMNRLYNLKDLSKQAKWRLAQAYLVSGNKKEAEELIAKANYEVEDYRELSFTFGSSLRDEAMILQSLADLGRAKDGFRLAKKITKKLNSNSWLSTQETAFALLAITKFYQSQKTTKNIQFNYSENGAAAINVKSKKPIVQKDLKIDKTGNRLKVVNKSDGTLYVTLVLRGLPLAGKEVASHNRLRMSVAYKTTSGKALSLSRLRQGQDFVVEVTIKNPGVDGSYQNLALTQIFPSGWEINNHRLSGLPSSEGLGIFDYQDIRDDRVNTFFSLSAGKKKVFRIYLNAAYSGRFYLPGFKCSAMYDDTIYANTKGRWIEIRPEQKVES